jgi:peroxiredoxin
MLKVGDPAPDIDALASDGNRFVLSQQGASCTVIYFFPKAFTPGCTKETALFRTNYAEIRLAGATLVGISSDDHATQCSFADSLKAPFPMIGDTDRAICKAYGVLIPLIGFARRVTFVVSTPKLKVLAAFEHYMKIDQHRDEVLLFLRDYRSQRVGKSDG